MPAPSTDAQDRCQTPVPAPAVLLWSSRHSARARGHPDRWRATHHPDYTPSPPQHWCAQAPPSLDTPPSEYSSVSIVSRRSRRPPHDVPPSWVPQHALLDCWPLPRDPCPTKKDDSELLSRSLPR